MRFLFIPLLIVLLHAIYNLVNYLRFPIIQKHLLLTYSSDTSDKFKAMTYKNQIVNYIKNANVKDMYIPVVQPLGYGQLASSKVSILTNILNPREDIALNSTKLLLEAKGIYWYRFINSVNPFYWLQIILFIPKYIFLYLGIDSDKIIVKIFQLIYWLIGVVFTVITTVFSEELKIFIQSLFNIS